MYQVNHLGHFLLVQLLLPHLWKSPAGGRVVVVGSKMSDSVKGWLTDPAAVHAFAQQQQQQGPEGAGRVVAACGLGDSHGIKNGVYYVKRQPAAIGVVAGNAGKAKELWQLSCEAIGNNH
eukprot:gene1379-1719_t